MTAKLDKNEIHRLFMDKQKTVLLDVLKENPGGLDINDLMIKAKLSEKTLLSLLENLNISAKNGLYQQLP